MFLTRFKHGNNLQTHIRINLHTHEPLIGYECGVFMHEPDGEQWGFCVGYVKTLENLEKMGDLERE